MVSLKPFSKARQGYVDHSKRSVWPRNLRPHEIEVYKDVGWLQGCQYVAGQSIESGVVVCWLGHEVWVQFELELVLVQPERSLLQPIDVLPCWKKEISFKKKTLTLLVHLIFYFLPNPPPYLKRRNNINPLILRIVRGLHKGCTGYQKSRISGLLKKPDIRYPV